MIINIPGKEESRLPSYAPASAINNNIHRINRLSVFPGNSGIILLRYLIPEIHGGNSSLIFLRHHNLKKNNRSQCLLLMCQILNLYRDNVVFLFTTALQSGSNTICKLHLSISSIFADKFPGSSGKQIFYTRTEV